MERSWEDELREKLESTKRWIDERNAQVAQDASELEARGRKIYGDAIRNGQHVVARTPQEVRALGAAANAGVRSAANAATLGYADNLSASANALIGMGGAGGLRERYRNNLANERRWDREGARQHPTASRVGQVLGTLGGIAAADIPLGTDAIVSRLFPAAGRAMRAVAQTKRAGFVPEGLGTMAAVGGGTLGGGAQLVTDALDHRQTSFGDMAGAVIGGALGAERAVRGQPVWGSAIGSGMTTAIQDGARGDFSPDAISRSMVGGAYLGRALDTVGAFGSNALPRAWKGKLGEGLTVAKSYARGETVPLRKVEWPSENSFPTLDHAERGLQSPIKVAGSYTPVDALTDWGRALEAKFGSYAHLSTPQKLARAEYGDRYLPDHWLPSDVGNLTAGWLGPAVNDWMQEQETFP